MADSEAVGQMADFEAVGQMADYEAVGRIAAGSDGLILKVSNSLRAWMVDLYIWGEDF